MFFPILEWLFFTYAFPSGVIINFHSVADLDLIGVVLRINYSKVHLINLSRQEITSATRETRTTDTRSGLVSLKNYSTFIFKRLK